MGGQAGNSLSHGKVLRATSCGGHFCKSLFATPPPPTHAPIQLHTHTPQPHSTFHPHTPQPHSPFHPLTRFTFSFFAIHSFQLHSSLLPTPATLFSTFTFSFWTGGEGGWKKNKFGVAAVCAIARGGARNALVC